MAGPRPAVKHSPSVKFRPPRLLDYILSSGKTKLGVAHDAGVSPWVMYRALQGRPVSDKAAAKIINVLAQSPPVVEGLLEVTA